MTPRERIVTTVGLIAGVWGVALLCLATLDWLYYQRFLGSLLYR